MESLENNSWQANPSYGVTCLREKEQFLFSDMWRLQNQGREDAEMYPERRPTCVTVIGWVWIIFGGLMCVATIIGVCGSIMSGDVAEADVNRPFISRTSLLLYPIPTAVAALGLVAGINFLKLKAWSHHVLEALTCLFHVLIAVVMALAVFGLDEMMWRGRPYGLSIVAAFVGFLITGVCGVPFGIMLEYMRGEEVRNAMQ